MTGTPTVAWTRLRVVFHALLDTPEGDRRNRLDHLCGDDPALRREAETLLEALAESSRFLDAPFGQVAAEPKHMLDEAPPRRLGPYALERQLGQGGMGAVYLAVRDDDEYRQKVAIKIVRPDVVTDTLVTRFRAERQILADLKHPHIAQLLDGGTTATGQPYLVMEYVEGERIDRFADSARLDIDARIALFVDVCRAVHAAHKSLVVHRDLKPANLLITRDGEPKLLDFGVAKLLPIAARGDAATGADLTVGMAPMTLDYASPEQILHQPITTASDVYSLGIVLAELLAGDRPLHLATASPAVLVEAARQRIPPRCSSLVADPDAPEGPRVQEVAARRGTTPARLRRRLEGDLDTIVAKALAKDPQRRYASAEDLAQDLERFRRGLPVAARPDTLAYRAGKFVTRHRWAVLGATIALAVLVTFLVALWRQGLEVRKQKARSEAASDFLAALFDLSNPQTFNSDPELRGLYPERLRGEDVTARELLDVGARQLLDRLEGDLEVQSEVMSTIGWAYAQLGVYSKAKEQLSRALDLARDRDGARAPSVAAILVRLAAVHRETARYDEAEESLDVAQTLVGPKGAGAPIFEEALGERARLAVRRGRLEDAESATLAALDVARRLYGDRHPRVAAGLEIRADLDRERGHHESALVSYDEALAIYTEVYGARHPQIARVHHDLGIVYRAAGRYRDAESSFERALAMQREIHGGAHPSAAVPLHGLAELYRTEGDYERAAVLAEEALALRRAAYGPEHPTIGLSLNLLGLIRGAERRFQAAASLHRQALDVWQPLIDGTHVWIASAHNNLASALAGQEQFAEAESHYAEALSIYRRRYREPHFQVGRVLSNLGALARRQGRLAEAESRYDEALTVQRAALAEDHPDLLGTMHNLAVVMLRDGRPAEAEPLIREAIDAYAAALGNDHATVGGFRITLARALRDQGQAALAADELESALAIFEQKLPDDHPWRQAALRDRAALSSALP